MQLGEAVVAGIKVRVNTREHHAHLGKRHIAVLVGVVLYDLADFCYDLVQRDERGGQLLVVMRLRRRGGNGLRFLFRLRLLTLFACGFFGLSGLGLLLRGFRLLGRLLGSLFGHSHGQRLLFHSHQHVQVFEGIAGGFERRGGLALSHANDEHTALAQARGQPREVGI